MKTAKNIFSPDPAPLSVAVLVMEACNTLALASVIDPMRAANRRAGRQLFDWTLLTPGPGAVRLTSGIDVAGMPLAGTAPGDALFVVAGFRLEEQCTPDFLNRLRRTAGQFATLGGVDGGGWILARAGLLNGERATTHWEDLENFAARFPAVEVVRDRYVVGARTITTGGAAPALDMMLDLIATRFGPGLARQVASAFIYDPAPPASAPQSLVSAARLTSRAPKVARAVAIMEDRLEDPPRIAEIAAAVGLTARHLENRFRSALGTTPGAFFLSLRLAEARRLASDTALPVQEIALRTGFASQAAFARAFRRAHGMSVRDMRRG